MNIEKNVYKLLVQLVDQINYQNYKNLLKIKS